MRFGMSEVSIGQVICKKKNHEWEYSSDGNGVAVNQHMIIYFSMKMGLLIIT